MKFNQLTPTEALFTWIDPDTHEQLTFAVDRLVAAVAALEIVLVPVDQEVAERYRRERGIEQHRLQRMTPDALQQPICLATMPDGTHLMIDGHHRYVYAASIQAHSIQAHLIPEETWKECLITDMPHLSEEFILNTESGL